MTVLRLLCLRRPATFLAQWPGPWMAPSLGGVIDQLKGIMIKSPDSSGSTTTPDSKGESFEVLSSDDEKEVEPTTSKKPSTSLEARGGSTVGEYLKREKAKHLAKQKNDKMDKPENPHVLPKSVFLK